MLSNNADLKTGTWLLYCLRLRSRSPHNVYFVCIYNVYNWGERERAPPWEFNAPPVCQSTVCVSGCTLYVYTMYMRAPPWEFNAPPVCLSIYIYIYIYIYISCVRHFWSRGPRATRKRKPAHLKFRGHMR